MAKAQLTESLCTLIWCQVPRGVPEDDEIRIAQAAFSDPTLRRMIRRRLRQLLPAEWKPIITFEDHVPIGTTMPRGYARGDR